MTRLLPRLAFWNMVVQAGIIVTGVAVRATGSGLGCPTWPQCGNGSFIAQPELSWHSYVENGNRMLTWVLGALAITTLVAVRRAIPDDRRSVRLAWIPVLGTLVQGILGGITVLVGLNPLLVMAHFLVSLPLIWAAHSLWVRVTNRPRLDFAQPIERVWASIIFWLGVIVLVLGTIATGSGPHSGDANEKVRFPFEPATVSWIHAMSTTLFIGLAIGLWAFANYLLRDDVLKKAARGVLDISGAQILVGFLQFAFGLPWWMLIVHAAFAAWFWIAVLNVKAAVREI